MSFYAEMAFTADELLKEFGVTITLRTVTAGAYDPETGTASITTVDVSTVGYFDDYKTAEIDGSLVLRSDRRLYLSAIGIARPTVESRVVADGIVYQIISVKAIPGAGTASLFDIQVRA